MLINDNKKRREFPMPKMFIGTRAVYNGGNSKNITIPKAILKELEKKGVKEEDIKEADIYYDREKREMLVAFNVIVNEQQQK